MTPAPDIPQPRRRYRAPARQASAAATREQILDAAEDLFVELGFADSTVAAIADRAGVATPTVYARFGSKAALLKALLGRLEERADAAGWVDTIRAEQAPAGRIAAFARWSRSLYEGGHGLIRASYRTGGDSDVAALHAEGDRRRQEALATALGDLAHGIGGTEAVDAAFVLTSPSVYLMCVEDCGWSTHHYEQWLTGLLTRELLLD